MKKKYNTRNSGTIQSRISISDKRALPSSGYLKSRNGPVKVVKAAAGKPKRPMKLPEPYRQEFAQNMQHLRSIMNED